MGVGQSDDPFDAGVGIWFHVRYNDNEKSSVLYVKPVGINRR